MKRRLAFLLMAVLLAAAKPAQAAETFSARTAQEARIKALAVFDIAALSMEYPGENAQQGHLIRWENSIRIHVDGRPTDQDRKTLDTLLLNLALRVPTLPNITLTSDPAAANMHVYFVPLSQMKNYVPGYVENSWGMFHYTYQNWRITETWIGIASDVTSQKDRNHLIQEEIIGALGLLNDHSIYSDSIVYQLWTVVQQPSEVDWLMLNMVYSPLVSPGMEKEELHRIFLDAWAR